MFRKIKIDKKYTWLGLILLIGGIVRFLGCNWGLPYLLHPDEGTIVNGAIDMIHRRSFEPAMYYRPDHFEIQVNSILFNIYSIIKFHVLADAIFSKHTGTFYLIARCFTAFWGTSMIPMAYLILEKVKKGTGLFGAALIAFFPSFITHSHYATPDIPLAFMFMVIMYFAICYLENSSKINMLLMCIFTSVSITIKYPAIIACILIAIVVTIDSIKKRDVKKLISHGFMAVSFVILGVFILSPVLFTNFETVVKAFNNEARPNHLGADGLGYWGNIWYYVQQFALNGGIIYYVFSAIGIAVLLKRKNKLSVPLFLGVIYWIVLSAVSLHWERWALPMYISPILLGALGIYEIFSWVRKSYKINKVNRNFSVLVSIVMIIFTLNLLTGVFANLIYFVIDNSRIISREYCDKNNINSGNSIYEGYTPLNPTDPILIFDRFVIEDDKLLVDEKYNYAKYIILSNNMYGRFYDEPKKYTHQINIYNKLNEQYTLVKEYTPISKYASYCCIVNIYNNVEYATKSYKLGYIGDCIKIYSISNGQVYN
jgi:hypothetical protein